MAGQRRLDRILADDYLDDLRSLPTAELRRRRDECEEEESGISYARRVLQGRLDILRAEAVRRREAGQPEAGEVLAALPEILGDQGHTTIPTQARATRFLVPPTVRYHRREVDSIASDESIAALTRRSTGDLRAAVEQLAEKEHELSQRRRELLDRLDALQDELVRRYKSGAAQVSEVLS